MPIMTCSGFVDMTLSSQLTSDYIHAIDATSSI